MPRYLLHLRGDGEEVGYSTVSEDYAPQPGEVVVDELPSEGHVWDAAASTLRPKTDAEKLEEAKQAKIDDFARRAIDDLAAHFTGEHGRDETMNLVIDAVVRLCQQAGVSYDPRLDQIRTVAAKAYQKKAAVEGAQSLEELEGIEWT